MTRPSERLGLIWDYRGSKANLRQGKNAWCIGLFNPPGFVAGYEEIITKATLCAGQLVSADEISFCRAATIRTANLLDRHVKNSLLKNGRKVSGDF